MADALDEANVRNDPSGADHLPAYLRKQARQPHPLTHWLGSEGWARARTLVLASCVGALLLVLILVTIRLLAQ
jgi:hypothetical protein